MNRVLQYNIQVNTRIQKTEYYNIICKLNRSKNKNHIIIQADHRTKTGNYAFYGYKIQIISGVKGMYKKGIFHRKYMDRDSK